MQITPNIRTPPPFRSSFGISFTSRMRKSRRARSCSTSMAEFSGVPSSSLAVAVSENDFVPSEVGRFNGAKDDNPSELGMPQFQTNSCLVFRCRMVPMMIVATCPDAMKRCTAHVSNLAVLVVVLAKHCLKWAPLATLLQHSAQHGRSHQTSSSYVFLRKTATPKVGQWHPVAAPSWSSNNVIRQRRIQWRLAVSV